MNVWITVVTFPLFFYRVNVERFSLLAIHNNFFGGGANRQIHTKARFFAEHFVQNRNIVLFGQGNLDELITSIWWRYTNRVDDDKFVESEMPFEERNKALPNWTIANKAHSSLDVVINCILFLICIHWRINNKSKKYLRLFEQNFPQQPAIIKSDLELKK